MRRAGAREPGRSGKSACLRDLRLVLSWVTTLRMHEAFRQAFQGFDPEVRGAVHGERGHRPFARLLADSGIVRSRAKMALQER